MIKFSTGPEKDHAVAINPRMVTHAEPRGNYTWIHLVNGPKHLVDEEYDKVCHMLTTALEKRP
jgi:hypothetical protein